MYGSHRKWKAGITAAILLAVLALSARLMAKPFAPKPSTVSQPRLSWSQNQVVAVVSAGKVVTKDVVLTSSVALQNASVEPIPQIAPFVTSQPRSVSMSAGQSLTVHLSFDVPRDTALGIYSGTIHVRSGTQTLPQTLKVTVHVVSYANSDLGIGFNVGALPTSTNVAVSQGIDGASQIDVELPNATATGFVPAFRVLIYQNPGGLDLNQWFSEHIDVNGILAAGHTFQQQQLKNGLPALVLSNPVPSAYLDVGGSVEDAFVMSPARDRVVGIIQSQDNDLQSLGYSQADVRALLLTVLGSVDFSQ